MLRRVVVNQAAVRWLLAMVIGVVVAASWLSLAAAPAQAHSFLVGTAPAQGLRLAGSPAVVVLEFSEPVDLSGARLEVHTADDDPVRTGDAELASGGVAVQASLPELDDGIYVVMWEAASAIDGHGTSGEFAFAVGDVEGALPASSSQSPSSGWAMVAGWLFFGGFAVSAGGLVYGRLAPDRRTAEPSRFRTAVRVGVLVATTGAAVAVLANPPGSVSSSRWFALAAVALLALGSLVYSAAGLRSPVPLAAVLAAAVAWSGRSHAAGSHGFLGGAVDFVHLATGGIWAGLLAFVAVELWLSRRDGTPLWGVVARYARVAAALTLALGSAGLVSAAQLLNTWSELLDTGYGRLILAKLVLFVLALLAAAVARWRGLAREQRGVLRRAVTFEGGAVAVVLVLAGVLAGTTPPQPATAAETLLGPAPLEGAVVRDAGLAGQLNVEVATEGSRLHIDVFGPSGPVPGTDIVAHVSDAHRNDSLAPRPCGPGCFTQAFTPRRGATTVTVEATAPDWTGGTFEAVLAWPPGPDSNDRMAQVVAAMRATPSLEMTETTTSGPGSRVEPATFTLTGEQLMASEPYAAGNVEVRAVDADRGVLRLYLPGSRIFVELRLDDRDRLASARLITPGHQITRTFRYPD